MQTANKLMVKILNFTKDTDEKLIKKAILGDKKSFGELIKIHKIYLYKTAYSYVKNEVDALEILQESTYRALLNIKKLKSPKYFKTWITKIVINCSIDFINKQNKENNFNEDITINYSEFSVEEKLDLYNAIDLLKDNYKTVVILKYFNDMTVENISNTMGIPENTVKTYLKRARDILSKILKEDYLNE